jgi:hypothetical protein
MLFERAIKMVLEGETVQENYIAISPLDYSEAVIRVRHGDEGRLKFFERYIVTSDKKDNLKYIKDELVPKLPEGVDAQWKKCYLLYGMDIMGRHKVDQDDGFYLRGVYIVKYPKLWGSELWKDDLFEAYLKPTNLSNEVKDTFGNMFTEL